MNESLKVQPQHLERAAYLYVRQSSMRQVLENIESTQSQYALRGRATPGHWVGARSRSLSLIVIKVSPVPRQSGARAFSDW